MRKFPLYQQYDQMDCGPSCLRMVAKFYGRSYTLQRLREYSSINRDGVSLLGISEAAEKIGFRTTGVRLTIAQVKEAVLPVILHWNQNHFVVLYKVKKGKWFIADPAIGKTIYSDNEIRTHWLSVAGEDGGQGIALMISPGPEFYLEQEDNREGLNWSILLTYLYRYKSLVAQLFLGLGVGSLLQMILPFLTQSLVDVGINSRDIGFVYIILIAQTMLFIGRLSVDFIRSWILLHMSTRINISILTDFLIKLMKLPVSFFDTKQTGDIMQRMEDQRRIESFLTGSTLSTIFSFFNLFVFSVVLAYYSMNIFTILIVCSVLYTVWILAFLKTRRKLDIQRFSLSAKTQSNVIQLVGSMQEIKLNNCERQRRWEWEHLQAGLFRFSVKSLSLSQIQQAGTFFINEGKNIIITFLVAKSVIDGQLTLGAMMAVQYIVGQVNSPIEQLLGFIQNAQDAKISLERLNEIHQMEEEEHPQKTYIRELPRDKSIYLRHLSFTYPGAGNEPVLQNIDLDIPAGKTTAIVGMSGSGKTTILKILLRFYQCKHGELKIGNASLDTVSYSYWRDRCGAVLQDGVIFSDTIARNIAMSDDNPDPIKLQKAIEIANISDLIDNLPLGLSTKIGAEGNGISQGQKQRILIARAVYKDPDYLFFDEATNALDASNEQVIVENLERFFNGRTVIIVAHRLSTVKNADNIIVLDKGRIVEQGSHTVLSLQQGAYYNLVKNQLELGI